MNWIGGAITCLVCHGTGWITVRTWNGLPMPKRCPGCHGSGSQSVRP